MNMISTAFPIEQDATSKQKELLKKLTSVWEKKNSKSARAAGLSLMALSLAACGAEDDTPFSQADVTAAAVEASAAAEVVAAAAAEAAAAAAVVAQAEAVAAAEFVAGIAAADAAAAAVVAQAEAVAAAEFVAAAAAEATAVEVAAAAAAAQTAAVAAATSAAEAAAAATASALKVSTDAALAAVQSQYDALVAPQSLTLTAATAGQTLVGRSGADTFTGDKGSIDAGDTIIDASTGDGDVANLSFNDDMPALTITNVETINVTINEVAATAAQHVDAANMTGVTTLNITKGDVVVGGSTLAGNKAIVVDNLGSSAVAKVVAGAGTTAFTATQTVAKKAGMTFDLDNASGSSIINGAATVAAAGAGLGDTVTMAILSNAVEDAKAVSLTTNAENIIMGAFTGTITVDGAASKNVAMAGVAGGATINALGEGGTTGTDGITVTAIDSSGVTINTTFAGTAAAPGALQINGTGAATDTATVSANAFQNLDNNTLVETLSLSGNTAAVTYNNTDLIATNITATGSQNVSYSDSAGDLNGVTFTDSSTGTTTVIVNGVASGTDDLSFLAVDTIAVTANIGTASGAAAILVANNANIVISSDQGAGLHIDGKADNDDVTITVADDTAASGAVIDISTTTFDAATNFNAVNLVASVGKFTATATTLATDAVLTISGSKDVALGNTTALTVNSAQSTGKISLDTAATALTTITTGSAADTVVVDQAVAYTVNLGDGANNLTIANAVATGGAYTLGTGDDIVALNDPESQVLVTGAGNDAVTIGTGLDTDAIIVMGDGGSDSITFSDTNGENYSDNTNLAITGVETLTISALTSGTHKFSAAQFANDNTFKLSGNNVTDTLTVTNVSAAGATIDASGVTHDAVQASTLILEGKALLSDNITGSAKNDTITATSGGDNIDGGLGTDTFNAASLAAATIEGANTGTSTGAVINMGATGVSNTVVQGQGVGYTATTVTSVAQSTYAYAFAGPDAGAVTNSAVTGTISGVENVNGTGGKDYIVGSGVANVINGGAGIDVIKGGGGNDTFTVTTDAESGDDIFDGGTETDTINVLATTTFSSTDTNIVNVENITQIGANIDLVLAGQTEGFTITGTTGNNAITGGAGNDTIITAAGADTVSNLAGGGIDTITFTTGAIDTVISTTLMDDTDYFEATAFEIANDLFNYDGAVKSDNGAVTSMAGGEDSTRVTIAIIATAKTSVHIATAIAADVIDGFVAGTTSMAQFETAAILAMTNGGSAGALAGLDIALADTSAVIAFVVDNEDTSIWRVENAAAGGANTLLASEISLVGIIQGDILSAAEMATAVI